MGYRMARKIEGALLGVHIRIAAGKQRRVFIHHDQIGLVPVQGAARTH